MPVEYKRVETLNEFIDAIRIRVDVFIIEQGFKPGWEPDEDDKKSKHFIAIEGGKVAATARYREMPEGGFKIERMAVARPFRGKGIGRGLLGFILKDLAGLEPKRIWLRSQVRSREFYEKCGFRVVSEPFEMYGFPHIDMEYAPARKILKKSKTR